VWYEGTGTTSKSWLYADHQSSIVGQSNSSGTSTAIYSYGPYCEPNVTTGSRFCYTGQQYLSGLGLYYYKARFYSPMLGRFLQTDPIGYSDDMNLYAYVGGNPTNQSDRTGLAGEEALGLTCSIGGLDLSKGVMVAANTSGSLENIGIGFVGTYGSGGGGSAAGRGATSGREATGFSGRSGY